MTNKPDNQDDLDAAFRRMQEEFGPRAPREGEQDPPPPLPPGPPPRAYMPPNQTLIQPQPARPQEDAASARAALVLLVINVGMYLFSGVLSLLVTGSFLALFTPSDGVLQLLGWKENGLIAQGEYWRLLTAMFLHGNLVHIFFNGYALYILGPESERIYGTRRFLALYFLSGLMGSIASYAFSPNPAVGASGAIFGLIGGLATFYYLSRSVLGQYGRAQLQNMAFVIIINLMIGFSASGIDNYAHMGGLLGGALLGWLLAPRIEVDQRFYPPVLSRRYIAWGWAGAGALLVVLVALAIGIQPPL